MKTCSKPFVVVYNIIYNLSLDTSLSLSLSHEVDFCDVIKKPGSGCYVISCLFKAFRSMKLGIRLTSPVCHLTNPSAARSIIINRLPLLFSGPNMKITVTEKSIKTIYKRLRFGRIFVLFIISIDKKKNCSFNQEL